MLVEFRSISLSFARSVIASGDGTQADFCAFPLRTISGANDHFHIRSKIPESSEQRNLRLVRSYRTRLQVAQLDVNRAQEELAICRRDNERLQAQIGTVTVILENNSTLQQTVRQLEHDFAEAKLSCSQLQQQLAELGSVREQYQRTIRSNIDLERQLDILRESLLQARQEADQRASELSALRSEVVTQQVQIDELTGANLEYTRDLRELRAINHRLSSRQR